MSSLRSRVEQLSPHSITPSIYRVPRQLRDINNKAYEPEMVSIGPYHYGKPKFKSTEELKLRYFGSLLQRKPELEVEDYVAAIAGMEAPDYYAEPQVNLINSAKFTDMLVLDGCFIIEVIRSRKLLDLFFPVRSSHRILQRDLMLLENQIPFSVLCKLYDLIEGPEQHTPLIPLVLQFCVDVFPGNEFYEPTTKEVKHILDLIYSYWYPPSSYERRQNKLQRTSMIGYSQIRSSSPRRIPCASQLKDANVKFRNISDTIKMFDLTFTDKGEIIMPTLAIEDWTESWLRNLIAYEQFLPKTRITPVTDYAVLLDSLINTTKDVQILSRYKIIENMLGSDDAVVHFVNRLTDRVMLYQDSFMYVDTFSRVNRHYRKSWNRAVASFHRDYFSSPWAYVAFLGALLLLLLTVVQTLFSAIQVYKPAS